MFQRLYELSRLLPDRPTWERLNEGMPPEYDRGFGGLAQQAAVGWVERRRNPSLSIQLIFIAGMPIMLHCIRG